MDLNQVRNDEVPSPEAIPQTETTQFMRKVVTRNQFTAFLNILDIISNHCDDVDIRGSWIRQTDKMKVNTFEVDLTSLFGDNFNFHLTMLKNKLQALKIFGYVDVTSDSTNQQTAGTDQQNAAPAPDNGISSKIIVSEDADNFMIQDCYSCLTFRKKTMLSNTFKDDPAMLNILNMVNSNPYCVHTISNMICKRMADIIKAYSANVMVVEVSNNMASYHVSVNNSENTSVIIDEIPLSRNDVGPSYKFDVSPVVVQLKYGDLNVKFLDIASPAGGKNSVMKFSQIICGIPVNIYCRSKIVMS